MKKILFLLLALAISLPAFAIRFERGNSVRISTPVQEDLYVAGATVSIDALIRGDLFAASGNVSLNDTITGDLAVGGGTVTLRGAVLDDVRAAGGTLVISGYIGGDLLIAGGTVTIESGAIIEGDIYVGGGTVFMNGTVRGNMKAGGGEFTLNGEIGKNADLNGTKVTIDGKIGGETVFVAQNVILGSNAAFNGNVRYWANQGEVNFGSYLKSGTATFDETLKQRFEQPKPEYLGFVSVLAVLGYLIAIFILLALGQKLFGSIFAQAVDKLRRAPAQALGYGFLYFAAVPVAIVLTLITVVGIPVGLIALFFYLLFLALAHSITALTFTHWLNWKRGYNWNYWRIVFVALGMVVLLKVITMIPFVGWLAMIVLVCMAFGAILQTTKLFKQASTPI
ncbi:MAG: polymer-forming cytoskeletal protein [Bacteroidota bacterium]